MKAFATAYVVVGFAVVAHSAKGFAQEPTAADAATPCEFCGFWKTVGTDTRETFVGLTPSVHLITLKDVDPPCAVVGGNPQPLTVVPGKTVTVRLAVSCGPATG